MLSFSKSKAPADLIADFTKKEAGLAQARDALVTGLVEGVQSSKAGYAEASIAAINQKFADKFFTPEEADRIVQGVAAAATSVPVIREQAILCLEHLVRTNVAKNQPENTELIFKALADGYSAGKKDVEGLTTLNSLHDHIADQEFSQDDILAIDKIIVEHGKKIVTPAALKDFFNKHASEAEKIQSIRFQLKKTGDFPAARQVLKQGASLMGLFDEAAGIQQDMTARLEEIKTMQNTNTEKTGAAWVQMETHFQESFEI